MAKLIEALLDLQVVERDLAQVRARLRARTNAVKFQQQRIDQHRSECDALLARASEHRRQADSLELELRSEEEKVSQLRTSLNTAKTNKQYAAVLTQINTVKADNAKVEERVLKIIEETDAIKAEAGQVHARIEEEEKRLAEIQGESASEIARLEGMMAELEGRRAEAARHVSSRELALFERLASSYDGDAMALVEKHGKKPPHTYTCGGCYMNLTAEHVNALQVRDEIRCCDTCGRILYLETQARKVPTE